MTRAHSLYIFIKSNLEAFIWIAAILTLVFSSPVDACYSLCPMHNLGINWCPGCGLGHSISWLFRGDIVNSIHSHPLGIPALLIIVYRILSIFRKNYKYKHYSFNKSIQHG